MKIFKPNFKIVHTNNNITKRGSGMTATHIVKPVENNINTSTVKVNNVEQLKDLLQNIDLKSKKKIKI